MDWSFPSEALSMSAARGWALGKQMHIMRDGVRMSMFYCIQPYYTCGVQQLHRDQNARPYKFKGMFVC